MVFLSSHFLEMGRAYVWHHPVASELGHMYIQPTTDFPVLLDGMILGISILCCERHMCMCVARLCDVTPAVARADVMVFGSKCAMTHCTFNFSLHCLTL